MRNVQIVHEHAERAIIDTGESKDCDLIVMASHCRHDIFAIEPSYFCSWLVIGPSEPHVYGYTVNHRGRSECAETFNERAGMFNSQQYRAEAAEYGELVKGSTGPDETRKFQERQDHLVSLADNEQGLADLTARRLQTKKSAFCVVSARPSYAM